MTRKKERTLAVKATRRLTGFSIPNARRLNAVLSNNRDGDPVAMCQAFGARLVAWRQATQCSLHPFDADDDALFQRGSCRFVLRGSCTGYHLDDDISDDTSRPWIPA